MQSRLMLLMAFAAGTIARAQRHHAINYEAWRHALVACTPPGDGTGADNARELDVLLNHKTRPDKKFHVKEAFTSTEKGKPWHFFNVVTAGQGSFECFKHEEGDANDCYMAIGESECKATFHGHCIWNDGVCDPPKDWDNADQRDAGFHQAPCGQAEWPVSDETVMAFSVQAFAPGCHVVGGSQSWDKAVKDNTELAQQKFIVGPSVGTFGFATISPSAMVAVAFGAVVGAMGTRLVGLRVVRARSCSSDEATLLEVQ